MSESIKEKGGRDVSLYVDNDLRKTDGKMIFLPEYLYGKSEHYYIIISIPPPSAGGTNSNESGSHLQVFVLQ